jgi:hypothetical protein
MLPVRLEIPFDPAHHECQGKNDQEIKGRGQVIKRLAVLFKTPPDHDPDIGYEKRDEYDDVVDDGYAILHVLFVIHLTVSKEKDQVHKGQEECQVCKVGYLQGNGGDLAFTVQPERLQQYDGNDIDEQECGDENKMQQELKEIIHALGY